MRRYTRDRVPIAMPLGVLRAVISSAIAITLPACARDASTAPPPSVPPAAAAQVSAITQNHSGIGQALADASTRLAPSIADILARARLNACLRELAAQLDAGDIDRARRALALARKVLASSAKNGEQADLAAIGLALDQVEVLLPPAALALQP
jgi:hypothetical protein